VAKVSMEVFGDMAVEDDAPDIVDVLLEQWTLSVY
jgi:hypothetical protein